MAAKQQNTGLAPAGAFRLARTVEGVAPDIAEEIAEELGDIDPNDMANCRRIKIPSGGGTAFEIEGEDDEPARYESALEAVLVYTHKTNAYWPGVGGSENRAPSCVSMDGKIGLRGDTGELITCESCPFNQFGSGTDAQGRPSRGKACKNMRRLFLVLSGDDNLYLLSVPPTSMGDVNRQLAKILASGTTYTGTTVRLTLTRVANTGGSPYSKLQLRKGVPLPADVTKQVIAMRRQVKEQIQEAGVTLADYTEADSGTAVQAAAAPAPAPQPPQGSAPVPGPGTFWEETSANDDNLPF